MEKAAQDLKTSCSGTQKNIDDVVRQQSKLDLDFDVAVTASNAATEKSDEMKETLSDFELTLQELSRRKHLLENETQRVNERLIEVLDKLQTTESNLEENERIMKVKEAQALSFAEKGTLVESQLEEAILIAEESHRKQDD